MSLDSEMFKSRCMRGNREGTADKHVDDFLAQEGDLSCRNLSWSCWCIHSVFYRLWDG